MRWEKKLLKTDFSPIENRSFLAVRSQFETCNVSAKRIERGRTPGMLSCPTLEGCLVGNITPRQAPEVVGRDEEVVVVGVAGITRQPAVRLVDGEAYDVCLWGGGVPDDCEG